MIDRLVTSSSIDLLERTLNFTERRHELIVQNIANIDTPGYVQQDAPVKDFQAAMSKAIDRTRAGFSVPLDPESTDTISFDPYSSAVELHPVAARADVFHDRGVRSVDMLMAQLAENAVAHNLAAQMLRSKYDTLKSAISLRA